MSQITTKINVTLTGTQDWPEWFLIINALLRNKNIKAYADPAIPTEPPQPVEPRRPEYSDVKPGVDALSG